MHNHVHTAPWLIVSLFHRDTNLDGTIGRKRAKGGNHVVHVLPARSTGYVRADKGGDDQDKCGSNRVGIGVRVMGNGGLVLGVSSRGGM